MGGPAQNGETENSKLYDFRIIGYLKITLISQINF